MFYTERMRKHESKGMAKSESECGIWTLVRTRAQWLRHRSQASALWRADSPGSTVQNQRKCKSEPCLQSVQRAYRPNSVSNCTWQSSKKMSFPSLSLSCISTQIQDFALNQVSPNNGPGQHVRPDLAVCNIDTRDPLSMIT